MISALLIIELRNPGDKTANLGQKRLEVLTFTIGVYEVNLWRQIGPSKYHFFSKIFAVLKSF